MPVPNIFATHPAGPIPASTLDENFAYLTPSDSITDAEGQRFTGEVVQINRYSADSPIDPAFYQKYGMTEPPQLYGKFRNASGLWYTIMPDQNGRYRVGWFGDDVDGIRRAETVSKRLQGTAGFNYVLPTTGGPIVNAIDEDVDIEFTDSTITMGQGSVTFLNAVGTYADILTVSNINGPLLTVPGGVGSLVKGDVIQMADEITPLWWVMGPTRRGVYGSRRAGEYNVVRAATGTTVTLPSAPEWSVEPAPDYLREVLRTAISGAVSNGAGTPLIRITTSHPHFYTTGLNVTIETVGGMTAANGTWQVTVIDANNFDLIGSTPAGSYTSGGTARQTLTYSTHPSAGFKIGKLRNSQSRISVGKVLCDPTVTQHGRIVRMVSRKNLDWNLPYIQYSASLIMDPISCYGGTVSYYADGTGPGNTGYILSISGGYGIIVKVNGSGTVRHAVDGGSASTGNSVTGLAASGAAGYMNIYIEAGNVGSTSAAHASHDGAYRWNWYFPKTRQSPSNVAVRGVGHTVIGARSSGTGDPENDPDPDDEFPTGSGSFSTFAQFGIGVVGSANNGSGAIRLTIDSRAGRGTELVTGMKVNVASATGAAAASTNGYWYITRIDNATIDLDGSTFVSSAGSEDTFIDAGLDECDDYKLISCVMEDAPGTMVGAGGNGGSTLIKDCYLAGTATPSGVIFAGRKLKIRNTDLVFSGNPINRVIAVSNFTSFIDIDGLTIDAASTLPNLVDINNRVNIVPILMHNVRIYNPNGALAALYRNIPNSLPPAGSRFGHIWVYGVLTTLVSGLSMAASLVAMSPFIDGPIYVNNVLIADASSGGTPVVGDISVATLAALKALPIPAGIAQVSTLGRSSQGDGGEGSWVFYTGDRSASVTLDPQSGLWAAPAAAPTGASGAWKRQYSGKVLTKWFGTDIASVRAASVALGTAAKFIKATPGETYTLTANVAAAITATDEDIDVDFSDSTIVLPEDAANLLEVFGTLADVQVVSAITGNVLTVPNAALYGKGDVLTMADGFTPYWWNQRTTRVGSYGTFRAAEQGTVLDGVGTSLTLSQTPEWSYDRVPAYMATIMNIDISGTANNGSGLIRITTIYPHFYRTGLNILVAGVVGTTEANGTWQVTVIDATHYDLIGSTFTNVYVSGGKCRKTCTYSTHASAVFSVGRLRNTLFRVRVGQVLCDKAIVNSGTFIKAVARTNVDWDMPFIQKSSGISLLLVGCYGGTISCKVGSTGLAGDDLDYGVVLVGGSMINLDMHGSGTVRHAVDGRDPAGAYSVTGLLAAGAASYMNINVWNGNQGSIQSAHATHQSYRWTWNFPKSHMTADRGVMSVRGVGHTVIGGRTSAANGFTSFSEWYIGISQTANNGSGLIRLTIDGSTGYGAALVSNAKVRVQGIYGAAAASTNGDWHITKINNTTIDLIGSVYSSGVSPGTDVAWVDAGFDGADDFKVIGASGEDFTKALFGGNNGGATYLGSSHFISQAATDTTIQAGRQLTLYNDSLKYGTMTGPNIIKGMGNTELIDIDGFKVSADGALPALCDMAAYGQRPIVRMRNININNSGGALASLFRSTLSPFTPAAGSSFGNIDVSGTLTEFFAGRPFAEFLPFVTGPIRVGGKLVADALNGGSDNNVVQATNKATAVAVDGRQGTITMNAAALAGNAVVSFTFTNAFITPTTKVRIGHVSGGTLGVYNVTPGTAGSGSIPVYVMNMTTATPLSEAIVLRYDLG